MKMTKFSWEPALPAIGLSETTVPIERKIAGKAGSHNPCPFVPCSARLPGGFADG
jgi:hypothetical protein